MVQSMKNILNIFKNEIIAMLKDPGTLLIMIVGVFLYSVFYSIPFVNQILRDVPIGVIDMDNSSISREFVRNLDSNEFVSVVSRPMDFTQAQEQFFANKIRGFVLIPRDFEKNLLRGGSSSMALFEDSAYLLVYKQVSTGVLTTAGSLSAKLEIGKFMKKGLSKQQAMNIKLPIEFVQIPLYNPAGGYENYIYPLVLVLILQQTMLVGVGLLGGTLKELVSKCQKSKYCDFSDNPVEIVLGKSFAYTSFYMAHSLIYFLAFPALFVYEMTYNIPLMLLLLIPYLFSIAFLGQALIWFYSERENSLLMLVVTSLPLIFLPGFVWPKEAMPLWLVLSSKLIPATSAMAALTRVNQMGANFHQISGDFWTLVALCILYFYLACQVAKKLCK